jgi:uncharacterized membrane protein
MAGTSWAFTEDLPSWAVVAVGTLVLGAIVLLLLEVRRGGVRLLPALGTGVLGVLLLGLAILRPVRVTTEGELAGAPVAVLVDQSRRLLLPAGSETRRARALEALKALPSSLSNARLEVLGFGDGGLGPLPAEPSESSRKGLSTHSDLIGALELLASRAGERPRAVVVLSDGRLTRPAAGFDAASLSRAAGGLPVHTVALGEEAPVDASIRAVRSTGTAVAHQSFPLEVEVGCDSRLDCAAIPVVVRELLEGEAPVELATGTADARSGSARIELEVTLERAGPRIVEVALQPPSGDEVPANDTRLVDFQVARDRVRILHVAGRPTYDVRALRMFLKSDESIDLVAFFILRTLQDRTDAEDSELALIPFPVDELFTEHLPSFDAVVLQDIDAVQYKLQRHLPALASYVRGGGGLIMVGGPSAFVGGGYADTPLEEVLPVALEGGAEPFDRGQFVPRYTEAGRAAPILEPLRQLVEERLPSMVGSNTLGPSRPGALVLWEHPTRTTDPPDRRPMPLLAVAEVGDGRSIALGADATHLLTFSDLGAEVAGRGHGALWEGLLGWLMRDPRYEPASMQLEGPCIEGEPITLRLTALPSMEGNVLLELSALAGARGSSTGLSTPTGTTPAADAPRAPLRSLEPTRRDGRTYSFDLGDLPAGGYIARATLGNAPPTRFVFACEKAGEAWSDSRPDPERLRALAQATGGVATDWKNLGELPEPQVTLVAALRQSRPLLPPWVWTLLAAAMMGAHWFLRRSSGLS